MHPSYSIGALGKAFSSSLCTNEIAGIPPTLTLAQVLNPLFVLEFAGRCDVENELFVVNVDIDDLEDQVALEDRRLDRLHCLDPAQLQSTLLLSATDLQTLKLH